MQKRATDTAVLKLDFKDYLITRVNVEERLSIGDKIGTLGGMLGKSLLKKTQIVYEIIPYDLETRGK